MEQVIGLKGKNLYNMDCLDFLKKIPDNSVGLILMDPPFGISKKTGFQTGGGKQYARIKTSLDFGEWDKKKNIVDLDKVIQECYRILYKGGTIITFYDYWKITQMKSWMEKSGFRMLRLIEWMKTNPVPRNQYKIYLGNAMEFAICGVKGSKPVFHGKYDPGIYKFPICHGWHPTQKPLKLFEELIKKHSNYGDIILDPFLGSGTTAIAALNLGRKILGCEKDKKYFNKMIETINQGKI